MGALSVTSPDEPSMTTPSASPDVMRTPPLAVNCRAVAAVLAAWSRILPPSPVDEPVPPALDTMLMAPPWPPVLLMPLPPVPDWILMVPPFPPELPLRTRGEQGVTHRQHQQQLNHSHTYEVAALDPPPEITLIAPPANPAEVAAPPDPLVMRSSLPSTPVRLEPV